jgi:hypothetical protein
MRWRMPSAELATLALICTSWMATVVGCAAEPPCRESYRSCTSDDECPANARCELLQWEYGSGRICREPCADLRDCDRAGGRDGLCLDVARDGTFFCYRGCAGSGECPIGWVCQPYTSSESRGGVCLP